MTRKQKSDVINTLVGEFAGAEAIVVCDYRGLSTKKLEALRDLAREQSVKVRVVKNTLADIALKQANKEGLELKDTNIYIWGEDQLSVTKVVAKFEENNSEFFKIKTGHIDGNVVSVDHIKALSKMPSRDELIAMLLQVWNAPIQNFTIGLNALKEKKEQSA